MFVFFRKEHKKLKRIIFISIIIVLLFSSYGCLPSTAQLYQGISPSALSFADDIYPLLAGELENTFIFYKEGMGLVFYTPSLPALNQAFSIYIPISKFDSGDTVTFSTKVVPFFVNNIPRNVSEWQRTGFSLVDKDNPYVNLIRWIIRPDMTWSSFVEAMVNIQVAPGIETMLAATAKIGTFVVDMPLIVIVPLTTDGQLDVNPKWWFLDDLFPNIPRFSVPSSTKD